MRRVAQEFDMVEQRACTEEERRETNERRRRNNWSELRAHAKKLGLRLWFWLGLAVCALFGALATGFSAANCPALLTGEDSSQPLPTFAVLLGQWSAPWASGASPPEDWR